MIIGIDLGTTFSLVSYIGPNGTPTLCSSRSNAQEFQTPSVVHIGQRGALVGEIVEQLLVEEPGLPLCRFVKLQMGTDDIVYTDNEGYDYNSETVSALILKKIMQDAESATGEKVSGAVITIPAHFNEAQRKATIDAGRLADLPVKGLVEEPVAAATYFGHTASAKEKTLFVYDLGGGTLDATILQATETGLYVLATEGAANIGGKNFDEAIMALIQEQFRTQYGRDVTDDIEAMQSMRVFATAVKIELSKSGAGSVTRPILISGKPMRVTVNSSQFEAAVEPWLDASDLVCEEVLNAVGMSWSDIDELVLTGGSSLLPCIQNRLKEISSLSIGRISQEQPHAAVAFGAAIIAEQQYGHKQTIAPPIKQTVTTNELGIRAFDAEKNAPVFQPLIGKNVPLPIEQKQTVYTRSDDQKFVSVEVLQRKDVYSTPEMLDTFSFGPLEKPKKNAPITISIGFDVDGRVNIKAQEQHTGSSVEREVAANEEELLADQYQRIRNWTVVG